MKPFALAATLALLSAPAPALAAPSPSPPPMGEVSPPQATTEGAPGAEAAQQPAPNNSRLGRSPQAPAATAPPEGEQIRSLQLTLAAVQSQRDAATSRLQDELALDAARAQLAKEAAAKPQPTPARPTP
jgi:hypothetical protein